MSWARKKKTKNLMKIVDKALRESLARNLWAKKNGMQRKKIRVLTLQPPPTQPRFRAGPQKTFLVRVWEICVKEPKTPLFLWPRWRRFSRPSLKVKLREVVQGSTCTLGCCIECTYCNLPTANQHGTKPTSSH